MPCAENLDSTNHEVDAAVVAAVMYALRSGCFFPVRQPSSAASVQAWVKWGALQHLHNVIAARHKAGREWVEDE